MKQIVQASHALLAALGTMSDFKVAATFGIRPYQVRELREEGNIPAVASSVERQSYCWSAESDALLGTMADTVLAKQLGTSRSIVNFRRTQLHCSAFEPPSLTLQEIHHHTWSAEEEALLGTDYDNFIAEQLNLHQLQVTHRRNRLGIEPFRRSAPILWSEHMLDNLGEISDKDFAEYFEICVASVYLKRLLLSIPAFGSIDAPSPPRIPEAALALLGIKSDVDLAKEFAVGRWLIRVNRLFRGLSPAIKQPRKNQTMWTAAQEALLGSMSDGDLSKKIGIGPQSISYRRRALGIESFKREAHLVWDEQKLAMLGRSQDLNLAQMWHCDVEDVRDKRESLRLEPHLGPRIWLDSELVLLGTKSDPQTAKLIGISSTAVRNKRIELNIKPKLSSKKQRWSKKHLALLGTMADERQAYLMKVTSNTVSKKRKQLLIPIWSSPHKGTWADPKALAMLGTMPDPDLAKILGNTAPAVFQKRKQMGIPPFVVVTETTEAVE